MLEHVLIGPGELGRVVAIEHVGALLDRAKHDALGVFVDNTDVATRRGEFASAFSTPKTIPVTLVKGSNHHETVVVKIDSDYAEAVFDAAASIVYCSDIAVVENATKENAVWTNPDSGTINVNPRIYEGYYMHEDVAAAYDGFWILMHELFHAKGATHFPAIITQASKSMTHADTGAKVKQSGDEKTWQSDYEGQVSGKKSAYHEDEPGPIVSLVNVLRLGYGLPIRQEYGQSIDTRRSKHLDMKWLTYGPGKDSPDVSRSAVRRKPGSQTSDEERMISDDLVLSNTTARSDDIWTDRLRQARLYFCTSSICEGYFIDTGKSKIRGRLFDATFANNDKTVRLRTNWRTNNATWLWDGAGNTWPKAWPVIEMGDVTMNASLEDSELEGSGSLESPTPFYSTESTTPYEWTNDDVVRDVGTLTGDWWAMGGVVLEKGSWRLELGEGVWDPRELESS